MPEALLVHSSALAGVGEGKVMADMSSLTALAKIAGPVAMGRAYFAGQRRGVPSLWSWAAASCHGIAQALVFGGLRS